MGDNIKILRFDWRGKEVDIKVDVDKSNLLDIVIDYEDEAKKLGKKMNFHFPTFGYVYEMEQHKLIKDSDLMKMFDRLSSKEVITIWVGTVIKPNELYKLVLNFRRRAEAAKKRKEIASEEGNGDDEMVVGEEGNVGDEMDVGEEMTGNEGNVSDLDDTELVKTRVKKGKKPTKKAAKKPQTKNTSLKSNIPPPISPQTAFKSLTVRRSPRFSPVPNTSQNDSTIITSSISDQGLFRRKIPRTTAKRKGLLYSSSQKQENYSEANVTENVETYEGERDDAETQKGKRKVEEFGEPNDRKKNVKRKVDFDDSESEDVLDDVCDDVQDQDDEYYQLPKVKDMWKADKWHDFIDPDDDDEYYQRLYKNGEMYDNKEFGKIELRAWMIFMDKQHFKSVLRDYCIQEGFAITVMAADNKRYRCTCSAKVCNWRLHASRLSDGVTWAIKKIEPNKHTCRGLETYNPVCNVKWAGAKLMEDIRANPDIPGKGLNELLFQRYGVYLKQASLYLCKRHVIEKLYGGHDESYALLPAYAMVISETNPDSKAFCSHVESESIPKTLLFSSFFVSFAAMWKGFLGGCRPLIGIDVTHLKGNYGGILFSAVALDANNEIFPLAYAIVSIEDKDNWSFFLWNIYNIVKESSRKDWTIISDRQKGIDLAIDKVWPTAKRRYCCRHLSSNFKSKFPGPLMYILFWRVCNATSQFTFRKAMERLEKEGGENVLQWFAKLGDPSTWSKHKFDPNVCNASNTSNFVESFNSTLGIDRCRPVLTLLEGIRRVCMVRMATRYAAALNWKDDDVCPKIVKLVKTVSKDIISCKAFMSKPGEYEIHEGKSQFPLSLNNKICSCGAWQISGVPCRHAIRAMIHAKIDPLKVVSSWYMVRTYKQTYGFSISPIPDKDQWPVYENLPALSPPTMKRGVGRPCRNRRREEGEEQKGKRSKTVKCTKCGAYGHNSRTCKGGLTEKQKKEMTDSGKTIVIRNARVRDQSYAAKATKVAKQQRKQAPSTQSSQANGSHFPDSQSQQEK